jgi:hypothetical protein
LGAFFRIPSGGEKIEREAENCSRNMGDFFIYTLPIRAGD